MFERLKVELVRFRTGTSGVTAIEYGLIAGLIAIVIITALTLTGGSLTEAFDKISAAVKPKA